MPAQRGIDSAPSPLAGRVESDRHLVFTERGGSELWHADAGPNQVRSGSDRQRARLAKALGT